jgi:hypothetical protein
MRAGYGRLHVRFDERRLETEHAARTEAPAMPADSNSPQCVLTAPVVDSTDVYGTVVAVPCECPSSVRAHSGSHLPGQIFLDNCLPRQYRHGAMAVVVCDMPDGATAVGAPAKILLARGIAL